MFHCRFAGPCRSCGVMGKRRKVPIKHGEVIGHFAKRLRELRVERGMTQAELAAKADVTATYVSRLEAAGAAPGIDLVDKLARALGVAAADLLAGGTPADPDAVVREQAEKLFAALLEAADRQTFALLNPFLALMLDAAAKRT